MTDWLKKAIFYEIYPQSFYDSNGDGIGDIPGIIEKLDYIKDLGCNAIWINPCFESPFADAGYDISNYYQVAPRYGTNEDLRNLFLEAHKTDIHVLLDLVPGHTSIEHPWFKESLRPEKNDYTDRYVWTDSSMKRMENVRGIAGTLRGISQRDGTCGVNCFSTQPALNYGFAHIDDPTWQQPVNAVGPMSTKAELKKIMKFWLSLGCDGFRVDMAGSLVKNEDDDKSETIKIWQEIRQFMDKEFPNAVLVSEWGKPDIAIRAGFHMDLFLHFGNTCYMDLFRNKNRFFDAAGKGSIADFVAAYKKNAAAVNGNGLMCLPSGNHDMIRLSHTLDTVQMKLAYAFIYSFPGAPFLYYGDEIGMRYIDTPSVEGGYGRTGSRSPMQWNKSTNAGFSSAPPDKLYIPLDTDSERPDAESQIRNPESIYAIIKKLICIRQNHTALQNTAGIRFLYAEANSYPLVYERYDEKERILIFINPSDTVQSCPDFMNSTYTVIYSYGPEPTVKNGCTHTAPLSVSFIKVH